MGRAKVIHQQIESGETLVVRPVTIPGGAPPFKVLRRLYAEERRHEAPALVIEPVAWEQLSLTEKGEKVLPFFVKEPAWYLAFHGPEGGQLDRYLAATFPKRLEGGGIQVRLRHREDGVWHPHFVALRLGEYRDSAGPKGPARTWHSNHERLIIPYIRTLMDYGYEFFYPDHKEAMVRRVLRGEAPLLPSQRIDTYRQKVGGFSPPTGLTAANVAFSTMGSSMNDRRNPPSKAQIDAWAESASNLFTEMYYYEPNSVINEAKFKLISSILQLPYKNPRAVRENAPEVKKWIRGVRVTFHPDKWRQHSPGRQRRVLYYSQLINFAVDELNKMIPRGDFGSYSAGSLRGR